jgi:hypothetical protein
VGSEHYSFFTFMALFPAHLAFFLAPALPPLFLSFIPPSLPPSFPLTR